MCVHVHQCAHMCILTRASTHTCVHMSLCSRVFTRITVTCVPVPVPVCTGLPTCVWISVQVHTCVCMSTSVLKLRSCLHVCERASSHLSPHEDKGRVKAG